MPGIAGDVVGTRRPAWKTAETQSRWTALPPVRHSACRGHPRVSCGCETRLSMELALASEVFVRRPFISALAARQGNARKSARADAIVLLHPALSFALFLRLQVTPTYGKAGLVPAPVLLAACVQLVFAGRR